MSNEENKVLQSEEIEALSAIYGDEWCVVDQDHKIYCIQVTTDGHGSSQFSVCIQVHMPENYPLEAPPEYQLNAPWLRGEEKRNLEGALAELYCDNIGESIIYLWVEKIREFLQAKTDDNLEESGPPDGRHVVMTTETEHGDDFDVAQLGVVSSKLSDIGAETTDNWECPNINHGETMTDRRSTFQPHLAPVFHKSQVKMVMSQLYENKKIANATHNIMAYRIVQRDGANPVMYQGCDDDGETHAGGRMLHLMQILDVENVVVVVSRWYGGILLGADRFKHINNCTRTILQQHDYIKQKDDKKGPRSTDKKKR